MFSTIVARNNTVAAKHTSVKTNFMVNAWAVGRRISEARRVLGEHEGRRVSQPELAKRVGVSRSSIAAWETGNQEPRGQNLTALAAALGCTPEYLLYGTREADPVPGAPVPNPAHPSSLLLHVGVVHRAAQRYALPPQDLAALYRGLAALVRTAAPAMDEMESVAMMIVETLQTHGNRSAHFRGNEEGADAEA